MDTDSFDAVDLSQNPASTSVDSETQTAAGSTPPLTSVRAFPQFLKQLEAFRWKQKDKIEDEHVYIYSTLSNVYPGDMIDVDLGKVYKTFDGALFDAFEMIKEACDGPPPPAGYEELLGQDWIREQAGRRRAWVSKDYRWIFDEKRFDTEAHPDYISLKVLFQETKWAIIDIQREVITA